MFGYISTKNLYLISLSSIKGFSYNDNIKTTYFNDDECFAIARKSGEVFIKYYDVFSGSEYKHWSDVRKEVPILFLGSKVKIEDLQRLLIEKNNICYDENKVKKLTK